MNCLENQNILNQLKKAFISSAPERDGRKISFNDIAPLPLAGGNRKYYRLQGEYAPAELYDAIGVVADNIADSKAFVRLSEIFAAHDVNVPQIYYASPDYSFYIEEDLGDVSLFSIIRSEEGAEYVAATMRMLAKMQAVDEMEWGDVVAYNSFSRRQALWDLNYFKYEFLRIAGVDFDEDKLEDDFERFATALSNPNENVWGFMMRDCQSRNVMIHDGAPCFIDYQGGRKGPGIYDAVSFLWQAKAGFSDAFRREMLKVYAEEVAKLRNVDAASVLMRVEEFVVFRTLQVLGAYGLRGLVEQRPHFLQSIPAALNNLSALIEINAIADYPELERVCKACVALPKFSPNRKKSNLTVKVQSFSFKKGYPADDSGNGGGFVFDCRGMHNPGRYDEYKRLTGRDAPVVHFLKAIGETDRFGAAAFELVAPTIRNYDERGFESLQVSFGCTGGQHRSVYCADRMAELIKKNFPHIKVELRHREQNIEEEF